MLDGYESTMQCKIVMRWAGERNLAYKWDEKEKAGRCARLFVLAQCLGLSLRRLFTAPDCSPSPSPRPDTRLSPSP